MNQSNDLKYLEKFAKEYELESNRFSCLHIAIRDARMISGSDIKTGKMKYDILESSDSFLSPYSFIGIINYLLVLELIGMVFKKRAFTTNKKNSIFKSLKQFSSLSDTDIDVIISLRNSLAHNYGLVNIPESQKEYKNKRHLFTLINTESAQLIDYPNKSWNGSYKTKMNDMYTKIGVHKLFDLVESVYLNLKSSLEQGDVDYALDGGIEELKTRFTIMH